MIRVRSQIFEKMETLSPSERKVARTLLADYPSVGLGSARTLAQHAGTSTPTVLRLVARLGMASYAEFQAQLRDEVAHELSSPVRRAEQYIVQDGAATDLARFIAARRELVDRVLSTVSEIAFERAATLLASSERRPILIAGGYYSGYIAAILARQLDQIVPNVEFLADPLGYDIGKFLTPRSKPVVVLFDLRRYQQAAQDIAALARQAKASLIVITDQGISSSADGADIVLAAPVDGVPFDSFAGLLTLVEALVQTVFQQTGERGIQRMKVWEERSLIPRVNSPAEPGRDQL